MHALNSVIGRREYNEGEFIAECKQFEEKYPNLPKPTDFDSIHSNQEHIMSFVLGKYDVTTLYIAPFSHKRTMEECKIKEITAFIDPNVNAFMVLTKDHVFTVKADAGGQWWNLDSLKRNSQRTEPHKELQNEQNGILFVWKRPMAAAALLTFRNQMADVVRQEIPAVRLREVREIDILSRIIRDINDTKFIAQFELPLSLFTRYYAFVFGANSRNHIAMNMFHTWFSRFCEEPGDRQNILRFVPPLVFWVLKYDSVNNTNPTPPRMRQVKVVKHTDGKDIIMVT